MASKEFEHGYRDNRFQAAASGDSDTAEHIQKLLTGSAKQNKSRDGLNPHGQGIKSRDLRVEMKSSGQDGSDADQSTSGRVQLADEDQQTIAELYRECPHLSKYFGHVTDFLDLLYEKDVVPYQKIVEQLNLLFKCQFQLGDKDNVERFCTFAAVIGFVEGSVDLYRKVMRQLGRTYLTDYSILGPDNKSKSSILQLIRNIFFNLAVESKEFSLRLVKAGFIQDLLEDLQHMQYMSADSLEEKGVYTASAATIYNCCTHPEVLPLVRQTDAAQHLVLFATKKGGTQFVQTMAMMGLSYIVEEDQVDLLRLDTSLLQFVLDRILGAISARDTDHDGWRTEALLMGLSRQAKCDFNKRIMVAQGTMQVLKPVLSTAKRLDEEKQAALNTIDQLAEDPHNLQVLQNDRELALILRDLASATDSQKIKATVSDIQSRIPHKHDTDPEDFSALPHLADLLSEELNALSILGMGEVEYVMDQLSQVKARGGRSNSASDVSCLKVLQAMAELTAKNEGCRREIMARGALDDLTEVVARGEQEEKTGAAKVLLELTFSEENREIMKNRTAVMASLKEAAASRNNEDLAQTTATIVQALNQ